MRLYDRWARRLPRGARIALDWILTIAVAAGAVLAFEAEVARPYSIPTESMEPTLLCARPTTGCTARFSDRVIACEICYRFESPQRGQIVVFRAPPEAAVRCGAGGTYVKRLIGLPGETVREDRHGFIWIDGRELPEPYISAATRREDVAENPADLGRAWHVPRGQYFFLGDNRGASCDSRSWGTVPRRNLIGPIVATYWPLNRLGVRL